MTALSKQEEKRFVTISAYRRMTGLGYKAIMHMIQSGQIKTLKTESGKYRIDTNADSSGDMSALMEELNETKRLLRALCKQFNTAI